MEAAVGIVHLVSPALAGALVASVWQGLLLTAVMAVCLYGLRGFTAASRTWGLRALLLLLLFLPALALLSPHAGTTSRRHLHLAQTWSLALWAAWAMGSAWRGFGLARSAARLWALSKRAVPVPAEGKLADLLRTPRRAELCVSAEVNRPSVTGFFWPRVLLPSGLLETLSATELEHVVRHEMEHLRRGDDWFSLLQGIGLVLFPLNPALLWVDRRLCREREVACDDGVLRATGDGKAYAACLVKLAEDSLRRKGVAAALSALGSGLGLRARESELMGRVRRILAGPDRAVGGLRGRLAVGALTVSSVVGAAVLAGSPPWVSFDGAAPPVMAEAGLPPTTLVAAMTPRMERVAMAANGGGARPHLLNAVMRRPGLVLTGYPAGSRTYRRRRPARMLPRKPAAHLSTPWATVPAKAEVSGAAPAPWMTTASRDVSPARVVVTEFEVAQPVYAAVPWGNGWLIVQL